MIKINKIKALEPENKTFQIEWIQLEEYHYKRSTAEKINKTNDESINLL